MKPLLLASRFLLPLALALVAPAHAAPGDAQFLLAREAFRAGDPVRLERAAAHLGDHDLRLHVAYYQLRMRLEQAEDTEIQSFLKQHDGSYVAEKLRADWLKVLQKKGRLADLESEFARLKAPEQDSLCLSLQARWARKDRTALEEAQALWLSLMEPPESCRPMLDALVVEKRVQTQDVWERIRRQFEANRVNAARLTMEYLPASQMPEGRQFEQAVNHASGYLIKLPAKWHESRAGRELAVLAVQRVAMNAPDTAAGLLERIQASLHDNEKQWAWGQIGLHAAKRHMPSAIPWFAKAGRVKLADEAYEWRTRAALRATDWPLVRSSIEAMPPELAARPEWVYWLGRAFKAGGRPADAQALFERIADQPDFYGKLACEELGRPIVVPPKAAELTPDEMAKAAENPGIKRALAFFRLDMRQDAVKEWNYSLRGMSDRELLATAELARRSQIFDRAINTANKTTAEHDYRLRFLAPYRDQVQPAAKNQSLDEAWVYGLMRQESRFITNAKSSVGASGLMQLMPATARWVAKKIGLKDYHHGRVNDTDVNLLLGTSYMRMVLEGLDNHPVLASAAYNAGPGRARKWQDVKPLEGAIYAETIPFNETRDYVKKVMSNAVYYSMLFNGKPDSLKARLGTIAPRGSAAKVEDLP